MKKPQASCADAVDTEALAFADALERIFAAITPLRCSEILHIRKAHKRYLADDIISPVNVPNKTNSAMDGYALRGEDLPESGVAEYHIIGSIMAGQLVNTLCQQNQCLRIMTGAPMPPGTDTVIMREQIERLDETTIRIDAIHRAGQNVRQAGEDVPEGAVMLRQGRQLMPSDIGLLASVGLGEVRVIRRPRVALFSTGNELKSIGETLEEGDVFDSNRYTLFSMLDNLGVEILDLGIVHDTPEVIKKAFNEASKNADLIISSGGVSMGDADYIKPVLAELGSVNFWKVAMKPGRPLVFGKLSDALFLGLPGNPVAVMLTFYQFVQPALQFFSNGQRNKPLLLKATLKGSIRKRPGRIEFPRAIMTTHSDGSISVEKAGAQGSGILSTMSRANCYLLLPEESGTVGEGDTVIVRPFVGLM